MAITDMFQIDKIKAELEATKKNRDVILEKAKKIKEALENVIAERDQLKAENARLLDQIHKTENTCIEVRDENTGIKNRLTAITSECNQYKDLLIKTERYDILTIRQGIQQLRSEQSALHSQIRLLESEIDSKRVEIVQLDDQILLQSFGQYIPRYKLANVAEYKLRLDRLRDEQNNLIKNGNAVSSPGKLSLNGDSKEGGKLVNDYVKLILRSFNNECDASLVGLKFSNVDAISKKISKAFDDLNNLGKRVGIAIVPEYLDLKRQELYLLYEYEEKKQQEKENARLIREQEREEEKLAREIEAAKAKLEKETIHYNQAMKKIEAQLLSATDEADRQLLEKEKANIETQLLKVEVAKQDVLKRESNSRAGYVYVISNVGSFGEGIYKIGVTRRLDPQERVNELGDASVPFGFDVHAMIFSEDAPALEGALHKAFDQHRINLVNARREFFKVDLGDIEKIIKQNFSKPVEISHVPDAEEFRQSMLLRSKN